MYEPQEEHGDASIFGSVVSSTIMWGLIGATRTRCKICSMTPPSATRSSTWPTVFAHGRVRQRTKHHCLRSERLTTTTMDELTYGFSLVSNLGQC